MSAARSSIVANGGANTASLLSALQRLGASEVRPTRRDPRRDPVILPGVGAAARRDDAAAQRPRSLIPTLTQPLLGICLGMQLLHDPPRKATRPASACCPAASRDSAAAGVPVPHMGWNTLQLARDCRARGNRRAAHAYFVHGYAVDVGEATWRAPTTARHFSACVRWRNFSGAQFHPERSAVAARGSSTNFLALPERATHTRHRPAGGRCVRLLRGDFAQETRYDQEPVAAARDAIAPAPDWLHVVDLDGAGDGTRPTSRSSPAAADGAELQVGGGVRDAAAFDAAAGAGRGPRGRSAALAVDEPEQVRELARALRRRAHRARARRAHRCGRHAPRRSRTAGSVSRQLSLWEAVPRYVDAASSTCCAPT